jgi:hypothetical protein
VEQAAPEWGSDRFDRITRKVFLTPLEDVKVEIDNQADLLHRLRSGNMRDRFWGLASCCMAKSALDFQVVHPSTEAANSRLGWVSFCSGVVEGLFTYVGLSLLCRIDVLL